MANSGSVILTYLPIIFLVVYSLVGGIMLGLWDRRRFLRRRQLSPLVNSEIWPATVIFQQLVEFELFVMVGVIITVAWYLFTSGIAYSVGAPLLWLTFGIVLVCVALLFASIDVLIVVQIRRMRHRVPHPSDAENP